MVAFLAVMLTIQCSSLIQFIELNTIISRYEMVLLLSLFLISFVLNLSSLLFFISTLSYLNKLQSSPKIDKIVNFGINNVPFDYLIKNTIISLNKCVENNKKILNEKSAKENNGLLLMKMGLIATAIFITYVLIIIM